MEPPISIDQPKSDKAALHDLERKFREAYQNGSSLHVLHFVDGLNVARGNGAGRFRLLARSAARAEGYSRTQGAFDAWIEILIRYLLEHDEAHEYIKTRAAALYINPVKNTDAAKSSSINWELSEGPWDRPGATIGSQHTIQRVFLASADCCLWLISGQSNCDGQLSGNSGELDAKEESVMPSARWQLKGKPVRRNSRYQAIDEALRRIAEARPKDHEEVFEALNERTGIPHAEPFRRAGGWLRGFRNNKASARAWLSKNWSRLNLPAFPRGPK